MEPTPQDGRARLEEPGFSYLPRFITNTESAELICYFAEITPLWEARHTGDENARPGRHHRRLTRPVYWLGAWQFACLGYYAEPDHRTDRCVRAEPFPPVFDTILQRLLPTLREHDEAYGVPPNSCLINYYGREVGDGPPRDYARLRMHRDGEPGPVVMFSVGQPGLLEFVDPNISDDPELALWTRHRSVSVLSGGDYKDRLYHRITQVRSGLEPVLSCRVPSFEVRRISVSFRHVPDELITDFAGLSSASRQQVRGYIEELATQSAHFRAQLEGAPAP